MHPGKISTERGFTMIATHNIKVNGRWYAAGEEVPEQKSENVKVAETVREESVKEEPIQEEAPKAEKPKTTTRRKK